MPNRPHLPLPLLRLPPNRLPQSPPLIPQPRLAPRRHKRVPGVRQRSVRLRGAGAVAGASAAGGAGGGGGGGEDLWEDGLRGLWEGGCEAVRWVWDGGVL